MVDSWFGIFDCRQSRTRPATLWLPHLPAAQWTAPSTDLAVAQRHSDPWAWVHMRLHYRIGAAAQRASSAIRGKSGRDGTEYERSTQGYRGLHRVVGDPWFTDALASANRRQQVRQRGRDLAGRLEGGRGNREIQQDALQ